MIRKLSEFWDAVFDRVYWFFVGCAILFLALAFLAADLFLKKKLHAMTSRFLTESRRR